MEHINVIMAQISVISEFIKFLSDNGVMLVICAVVVYFLVKVLNSLLVQNERVNAQIVPQLTEIKSQITDILVKINEVESRRTITQNRQLSEMKENERHVTNTLNDMKDSLENISDHIDRLNMYLEFKQKKDGEE